MAGRPSKYTPELADEMCLRMACGQSLSAALREMQEDPEWQAVTPCYRTVMRWLLENVHEGFRPKYARARELQGHADADTIRDIASDLRTAENRDKAHGPDRAATHYEWLASKHTPKVYGDLQKHEHSGSGGAPLKVVVEMPPECDD